ncbi:MAG: MBOAT family protein [Candidatus Azobacteroides sp.]|nr:MBOAT family protein [Candidatus Azobacteroides sp.]
MDISSVFHIDADKLFEVLTYSRQAPLIFSSGLFLFLFLFFSLGYYFLRNTAVFRCFYTILFSCYFYYKTSGWFVFLLLLVSASDYLLAYRIHTSKVRSERLTTLIISIVINLGLLCYFKYTDFFRQMIADLTDQPFHPLNIFLPVGISFFTFQSLSYTIDIYRKQLRPLRNLYDYTFFVTFFPQLVAGPIVRARDFIPQMQEKIFISKEMFGTGIFLIMAGLFKKAVISDYISVNFVERIFDEPTLYSGLENLFGVYGYALQIYCDFSGYSDMAIGLALLLGFKFKMNFDSPYKSATVTEFWRRWHISLSAWLRDYLYIPLGGNRKGKVRMYINLFLTMLLGGLWHGASLQFLFWGTFHSLALIIHKIYRTIVPKAQNLGQNMHPAVRILGILFTFHLVCFGWVFFRAETFHKAIEMLTHIWSNFHPELLIDFIVGYKYVCLLMLLGFVLHFVPKRIENKVRTLMIKTPVWAQALLMALLIIFVMQIKSSEVQPFIYFQF